MSNHLFKVGQIVDFHPNRRSLSPAIGGYEVLRLLPTEEGENQYQIKSKTESVQRIAKERDLSLREMHQ